MNMADDLESESSSANGEDQNDVEVTPVRDVFSGEGNIQGSIDQLMPYPNRLTIDNSSICNTIVSKRALIEDQQVTPIGSIEPSADKKESLPEDKEMATEEEEDE